MRLAIAAAIVAESPMNAVASILLSGNGHQARHPVPTESSQNKQRQLVLDFAAEHKKRNLKLENEFQPNFSSISTKALLRNDPISKFKPTECDPGITVGSVTDADVGILSCGLGQYCMESEESKSGGFCRESDYAIQRKLQADPGEAWLGICTGFTCSSCEYDSTDQTGYLACSTGSVPNCKGINELCDQTNQLCITTVFTGHLSYDGADIVSCYSVATPVTLTYCLSYFFVGTGQTCEVSIDGTKCNSCDVSTSVANPDSFCAIFDCTNTILQGSGDTCGTVKTDLAYEIASKLLTCPVSDSAPSTDPNTDPNAGIYSAPSTDPNTDPNAGNYSAPVTNPGTDPNAGNFSAPVTNPDTAPNSSGSPKIPFFNLPFSVSHANSFYLTTASIVTAFVLMT